MRRRVSSISIYLSIYIDRYIYICIYIYRYAYDGGCDDESAPLAADGDGDNKMDLTDLSMNLSQDPEVPIVSHVGLV